jgi:hypothetical protein
MSETSARFKPGVDRWALLLLAGLVWIGVGTMLVLLARSWLALETTARAAVSAGIGCAAALVIHHFGFLRVVDKNLDRILPMTGKRCVFSFMTWKSYGLVAVMVATGIALRHSPLPKFYLAMLYIGIGAALILSSVRYLRFVVRDLRGQR